MGSHDGSKTSLQEFTVLIKALRTVYRMEDLNLQENTSIWYALLKDFDYPTLSSAAQQWMMTERRAPTIADIRALCLPPEQDDEGEAWDKVYRAIQRAGYYAREEFDKLPPAAQKAVGSPAQLAAWAIDENFNMGVVQSNFLRAYRQARERERRQELVHRDIREALNDAGAIELLQD